MRASLVNTYSPQRGRRQTQIKVPHRAATVCAHRTLDFVAAGQLPRPHRCVTRQHDQQRFVADSSSEQVGSVHSDVGVESPARKLNSRMVAATD